MAQAQADEELLALAEAEAEEREQDQQQCHLPNDDSDCHSDNEGRTFFVGNIPYKVLLKTFKKFFSQFGNVQSVKYVRHVVTQRFLGAAFVKFQCLESADKARYALDVGLKFEGRLLRLGETKKKISTTGRKSKNHRKSKTLEPVPNDTDCPISRLNDDCLSTVLFYIDPLERLDLENVSKTWKRCAILASKRQKHLLLRNPRNGSFGYRLPESKLCKVIARCSASLVSLDLSLVSSNVKKYTVETIVSCCQNLTRIDISGCYVSNRGMASIATWCSAIKWIKLDNCPRITEYGMWSIFKNCKHLEALYCFGSKFSGKCFKIAPITLKGVHLRNCYLSAEDGLVHLSERCSNLTTLDLNNCQLFSRPVVSAILKQCTHLKEVNVGHLKCDTDERPLSPIQHLTRSLVEPSKITKLMVDKSHMVDDDLLLVCSQCVNVLELDISCNPLCHTSVSQLCTLQKLESLHICHLFNITDSSLLDVVLNGRLRRLRMQGCKKITDGLFEQMSVLCTCLEELDIAGVPLASHKTLTAFNNVLGDHPHRKLYIYAFNNAFLERENTTTPVECVSNVSLCVIYRHIYSSHSQWVIAGEDEPHNIVINRRWEALDDGDDDDEKEQEEQDGAMGNILNPLPGGKDSCHASANQPTISEVPAAIPADMLDEFDNYDDYYGDGDEDYDDGFLVNDDPLEQEDYEWS